MSYVTIGVDKEALKEAIRLRAAGTLPSTTAGGTGGGDKTIVYVGIGVAALVLIALIMKKK